MKNRSSCSLVYPPASGDSAWTFERTFSQWRNGWLHRCGATHRDLTEICSLNGYGKLEIDPHDDVDGDDDGDDDGDGGGNGGGAVMMPINMIMTKKMFYRRCTYLS